MEYNFLCINTLENILSFVDEPPFNYRGQLNFLKFKFVNDGYIQLAIVFAFRIPPNLSNEQDKIFAICTFWIYLFNNYTKYSKLLASRQLAYFCIKVTVFYSIGIEIHQEII